MKKLLAGLLIALTAVPAFAWNNGWHSGYYRGGGYRNGWVAPFVVGAVVGGAVAYAATPRYYPAPYIPAVPVTLPPPGYHYQNVFDPTCNCYRVALVPNY